MATFVYTDSEGNEQRIELPDDAKIEGGLRVDGKQEEMAVKDILTSATKASGADKKFREAAVMNEGGKKGRRVLELLHLNRPMTQDEFIEYAGLTEVPDDELSDRWDAYKQMVSGGAADDDETPPAKKGAAKPAVGGSDKELLELKQQIVDLRAQLGQHHDFLSETADKGVDGDIKNALNIHPQLSKLSEEAKDILVGQVRANASKLIVDTKARYGPDVLGRAVSKAAEDAAKLGAFSGGDEKAKNFEASLKAAGIGLGPDAGSGVSNSYNLDKPIEHVPVTDDKWEERVVAKGLQIHAKSVGDAED